MYVRPTKDPARAIVRIPGNHKRVMPPEGMEVPDNDFHWLQMIQFGDVELVKDLPPAVILLPAPDAPAEPEEAASDTPHE